MLAPSQVERSFVRRPRHVRQFLATDPKPRAIFLNSPHNPTGGVATREDLAEIADVVRGTELMVFSDEPYCHMVWNGRHASILAEPGMLEHTVAAYTFSKSYSMSGWRIGFAVAAPDLRGRDRQADQHDGLVQPSAGSARRPGGPRARYRDARRLHGPFPRARSSGSATASSVSTVSGSSVRPARSMFFRTFERSATDCRSHRTAWRSTCSKGPTIHFGVACLGGECFGEAGHGFLRFSCAEPDERIDQAMAFIPRAIDRADRVSRYRRRIPSTCSRSPMCRSQAARRRSDEPHRVMNDSLVALDRGVTRKVEPAGPDSLGGRRASTCAGSTRTCGRSSTASVPAGLEPHPDRFGALVRSIVSQQISTKAARSINLKLLAIGGDPHAGPNG